jgi:nitroimidazol reductase NimA-like FMN-containing flavoprotein (pyridoxamine 5'-phosphate oxidase superfamily)
MVVTRSGTGPLMADLTKSNLESLSEAECWELISAGGIGRIGYSGRYGPMIQPVNYEVLDQAIVFRTAEHSTMGEDLRTGIAHAEYLVAFEIDDYDMDAHAGWSVLIQGDAHYVESEAEKAAAMQTGVEAWVAGERNLFLRIIPAHVTGRRVARPG